MLMSRLEYIILILNVMNALLLFKTHRILRNKSVTEVKITLTIQMSGIKLNYNFPVNCAYFILE